MSALSEKSPYIPLLILTLLLSAIGWLLIVPLTLFMLLFKFLGEWTYKATSKPIGWVIRKMNAIDERYKK